MQDRANAATSTTTSTTTTTTTSGAGSRHVSAISGRRRTEELGLGVLALVIVASGYVLLALSKAPALPAGLWGFMGAVLGLFVVAHLAVRKWRPARTPTLLPLVALLLGIGFVTVSRLDRGRPQPSGSPRPRRCGPRSGSPCSSRRW